MTTCYLCGSTKSKILRRSIRDEKYRNVWQCARCSLVFLEPKKENLRKWYAGKYRTTSSPHIGKPLSSKKIFNMYVSGPFGAGRVKRVKPHLTKKKRVLDIGCSVGHFLYNIKPYVKEAVGIDLNVDNVKFVNKILGIKAYNTPVEETDLPHKYFDVIFCLQTMEHMPDPIAFLKSIKPYLKDGGMVYIEVPNRQESLLSIYHNAAYDDFYYHKPHLFYYTPKTLKALFKKAGYRGTVLPFQVYSLINSMHWLLTNGPQIRGFDGLRMPVLVEDKDVSSRIRKDFNDWMAKADKEYKKLLEKHLVSDQMVFVGKKK